MVMKRVMLMLFAGLIEASALNIEQAWQLVQERNDGLKAAQNSVKHAQLIQAGTDTMRYMPSIDLHGSYTHLSEPINLDFSDARNTIRTAMNSELGTNLRPVNSDESTLNLSEQNIFLANLSILWPIFAGGKTVHLNAIARAQIDTKKAMLELQRQKAFIQLVKYYYGVQMGRAYYDMRLEVESAFSMHYDHAKKTHSQGQIATVEVLNAQVQYDKAKIETLKAKHQVTIAISALQKLLKEQTVQMHSSLFINDTLDAKELYIHRALEHYPALHLLDAKRKQSASLVALEKANYLPTVAAFGNYNLYRDHSILAESAPDWFAGLAISVNLLSATGRSEKYEAAKIANVQLTLLRRQAQQDLSILVEKTYNEVILYLDEYKALDSSLELAKENVKLRRIAYNAGLSTSLELNDAELFLATTKTERLNVAYAYVQKLSQLMILSYGSEQFMHLASQGEEVVK